MSSKFYYILLLSLGFFLSAKATHNRAGEITYKWLFGFTYEIKVTTYTNIGSANLADRCMDTIYFGDGTHSVVNRSNGPIGGCAPAKEGVPITGTIKLNEYITTHAYPGPGNYKISMEDPNRNAGVINIPNSVNQVFYIESLLVIPGFGSGKNNSPVLTFPPIDKGCVSECFFHNPGAYDIDGDSLSYELTYCRGTSGAMCPGYAFPTTGGGTYTIDATAGTLSWCTPQLQGEYNLAMIIKEWRLDDDGNYFVIGYVLRDLQVDVGTCNNNPPQITINTIDTCIVAGTLFNKVITTTDPDNDIIRLSANGGPFGVTSPKATFSSSPGLSLVTGTLNWQTSSAHIRKTSYQVTVKAEDNDPTISLVNFKSFSVRVIPQAPRNLTASPSNDCIRLNWDKPLDFSVTGTNSILKYKIYRKTDDSPWIQWIHSNCETAPPASSGFTFIDATTDTVYIDFNNGAPFIPSQAYSYLVLVEYTDHSTSYVSNQMVAQIYVGLKELNTNNSNITVYPNPVNESFTISFDQNTSELFTIDLMDVTGRKIKTFLTDEFLTKQNSIQLKTGNITPGIYFLKITGDQKTNITKKIIKQ